MASCTAVRDGLVKQLKILSNISSQWNDTIAKSDTVFAALALLMTSERASMVASTGENDYLSKNLIPDCPAACHCFLNGDPVLAAHLAAANKIEDSFDSLNRMLFNLQEYVMSTEKVVQRLQALRDLMGKCRFGLSSSGDCSEDTTKIQVLEILPWDALIGEATALVRRLRGDLTFRRDLLCNQLPLAATDNGHPCTPGELSALWRGSRLTVRWENCLDVADSVREWTSDL